jgi:hypothetical protein
VSASSPWWLVSLLAVPGLLAIAFLMAWMEEHLAHQLVAHDVATAWDSIASVDDLEEAISRSTARVVPNRFPR